MANHELVAGQNTYLLYGEESTVGTTASSIASTFGLVKSFNPTINHNTIRQRGFAGSTSGGREVAFQARGKQDVSLTVELEPQNFNWLKYVLGSSTGAGTSGSPYVYTVGNSVTSLTVSNNLDNVTTDRQEVYLGSYINSMSIKAAVGESLNCSLDLVSVDWNKSATLQTNVALSATSGFTFVGGSIEIPNASVIPNVIDSIDLTITGNAEIKHGVGSAVGKFGVVKGVDHQVKFTVAYVDDTILNLLKTGAEVATLGLKFTNGSYYVDFVFTGAFPSQVTGNNTLNETVMEEFTFDCRKVTVTEVDQ